MVDSTHEIDMTEIDEHYMRQCIGLAQAASEKGEVPVGAILVDPLTNSIVSRETNAPIALCDPSAHAEIMALRAGGRAVHNYRLSGLTLYVTLEPCAMCAGAISHARIGRLVYGASDPKGGAVQNGVQFFQSPSCHSKPEVKAGVLAQACSDLLKVFFKQRRKNKSGSDTS